MELSLQFLVRPLVGYPSVFNKTVIRLNIRLLTRVLTSTIISFICYSELTTLTNYLVPDINDVKISGYQVFLFLLFLFEVTQDGL